MATVADSAAVDPGRTIVRLADGLTVQPQVYGDQTFYHLQWATEDRYYRIGYQEYVFLSLLDGKTNFSDALALTSRVLGGRHAESGCLVGADVSGLQTDQSFVMDSETEEVFDTTGTSEEFTQQRAMELYQWLLKNGLATVYDEWTGIRSAQATPSASLLQRWNPLWLKVPLGNPDRLLKLMNPVVGWIFGPWATAAGILFILAAALQLWFCWSDFRTASETVFAPDNWLWLLLAWIGLKVVHELAHGLTCVRYGGHVTTTGIIFAVLAPLAWVDLSSSWKFASRWQRIHTAAAGMYVEFLLAAAAIFAFPFVENEVATHLLFNVVFMASITTLIFNANPLMKFDGYYILSDLMQVPNLAQDAQTLLNNAIKRALFGIRSSRPAFHGQSSGFVLIYGVLAAFWKILICVSLLLAASVLFYGAGIALVIVAVAAWFGIPAVKHSRTLWQTWLQQPIRVVRAAILILMGGSLVAYSIQTLPAPFPAVAPGVVSLPEGNAVRVTVDGFVDEILVVPGESVREGTELFRLRNEEIKNSFQDLQLQLQQEQLRLQIAMDEKDSGEAALIRRKMTFLEDRFQQTQTRYDALTVKAKADGTVVGDHLREMQDRYVEEGEIICLIDSPGPREFRISVDQFDFPLAQESVGQTIPVRLGTRRLMTGNLHKVIPRASRNLNFPALAAHAGGPLAVKPTETENGESSLELTDQRFEAVVVLQNSHEERLPIGERGYVLLGHSDRTVASWAYQTARTWIASTLEAAKATQ